MRVGFYGNNLNYGENFVRKLRALGIDACLWLPRGGPQQDRPEWWSAEREHSWVRDVPAEVNPWSLVPRRADPAIREIYEQARSMDVLVFMEEAPALFAGFGDVPKVLLSQGHDVLHLPFLVSDLWLPRAKHDLHLALRERDGLAHVAGQSAVAIGSATARLARWSVMQTRQRRGIRECEAVVVLPFQAPLVERLGLDRAKVHYMQFVLDVELLGARDPNAIGRLAEKYRHFDTVFFHPTRHCIDPSNGFTKDNHKLIEAYAAFCKRSTKRTRLVIVEKGVAEDIAASRRMLRDHGIEDRVEWVGEMSHIELRSFYALENVVLCDQFNPDVASLGNIGREACFFGVPLITSANADVTVLWRDAPPPNVASADTTAGVLAAMDRFTALDASSRRALSEQTKAWCARNLSPEALMPRYVALLESVVRERRSRATS